jgi:hypothetical protein
MTYIEALLNVDAGHVPDGTAAFIGRDPKTAQWWRRASASVVLAVVAVVCAAMDAHRAWPVGLGLAAAIFAVLATLSTRVALPAATRPIAVVTPTAFVVRDPHRLCIWPFEDISKVCAWRYGGRADLLLEYRDGRRSFIDCRAFENGERIPDAIARYLPMSSE